VRQKVVLYNPRSVFYTMPLGLLAVGSHLDAERYDVRIIDGRLERDPVAAALAEVDDALCLGMSVLTGAPLRDALEITQAAQARRSDLPIVWGGWHPSLFPEQTVTEAGIDAVVVGQGEDTFAELVDCLAAGHPLGGLPGAVSRADLDASPRSPSRSHGFPAQSGIALRRLRDVNASAAFNYDLLPVERYFALKGERQLDYISSQGCRFRCAFCADPTVYQRGWFGLEPERVGAELEALWRRYQITDVGFQDETFFTSSPRVAAIAEELQRRGTTFTWMATMRADQGARLDEEVLATCKAAGLRRVMIGVESGAQATLDLIQKDITLDQVFASAEKCRRQGVAVLFNFIVGFPDEPPESVQESLRVAKQLRAMSSSFEVAFFYYKPYPGNAIADRLIEKGYAFPRSLEAWADFDYVGSVGDWVSPERHDLVERFKFYQRIAWSRPTPLRAPLQALARWRCANDFYGLPIEKAVVERFRRPARLS
jgi:anaerobic magnesium-protoporphyrin IX monomethyl ester cyclase